MFPVIASNHMHPDRNLPEKARGYSTAVQNPRREPSSVCTIGFSQSVPIDQNKFMLQILPGPTFSSATQRDECGQVYNIPPLRRCKGHQAGKHDVGSRTARNIKTTEVKGRHTLRQDQSKAAKGDKHGESHANFEHKSDHSVHQLQVPWMPPHSGNHDSHPV